MSKWFINTAVDQMLMCRLALTIVRASEVWLGASFEGWQVDIETIGVPESLKLLWPTFTGIPIQQLPSATCKHGNYFQVQNHVQHSARKRFGKKDKQTKDKIINENKQKMNNERKRRRAKPKQPNTGLLHVLFCQKIWNQLWSI